ncbi:hypothetical protein ABB02_01811 [Clostridiaceae bacterium JG1575]|nr:hypothetical protein ABB02_01811 [Clostridiaceae bacterium JG1575]
MLICSLTLLDRQGQQLLGVKLAPYDLSWRDLVALLVVHEVPGANQEFLRQFLGTDKANVTKLIQTLRSRGLMKKERSQTDQRSFCLYLTPQGVRLIPSLDTALQAWEEVCFSGFSEEERLRFNALQLRMIDNQRRALGLSLGVDPSRAPTKPPQKEES